MPERTMSHHWFYGIYHLAITPVSYKLRFFRFQIHFLTKRLQLFNIKATSQCITVAFVAQLNATLGSYVACFKVSSSPHPCGLTGSGQLPLTHKVAGSLLCMSFKRSLTDGLMTYVTVPPVTYQARLYPPVFSAYLGLLPVLILVFQ